MSMLKKYMRFISPPKFEDEEQTRVARILHVVAGFTLVGLWLIVIQRFLAGQFQSGPPFLAISIVMGLSVLVTRRGLVEWSSHLVLWPLLAFLFFQCYQNDGLRDTAVLAYPGLLVVAGLVLKGRHFFVFAMSSLLSILVLAYLEFHAFIPVPHGRKATSGDIVDVIVILSLIAITVRLLADNLIRSLGRARDSYQIIEGIINAIPARVFWKDKNLVYLGCNVAFARDAGFADPKDIIGKDDYQMGWCDQAELYRKDDSQVIESGIPKLLIEEPQTTPEGNTITLLTSKIPLHDSEGEISGVVGTYMDITERKREQIRLRQLSTVVEQSPVSIVITDTKGHIEYVNPRFVQLTGYTLQEVIGKDPRQLILGAKSPEEYSHVWATITAGGEWRGELHTKKKNGELFWEYASISPIKNESGIITHFLAVKEDITERKSAEDVLRESEEKFRELIEHGSEAILLLDAHGTIFFGSPAAERLLGYSAQEFLGRSGLDDLHPDDLKSVREFLTRLVLQPGSTQRLEYRLRHKDGTWRWIDTFATNSLHVPAVHGIVVNSRNITERKQVEEALRERERFMTALVTSLDDVVLEVDGQGIHRQVWTSNESLLTMPKSQLLGKNLVDVWGEEEGNALRSEVQRILTNAQPESIEFPIKTRQGAGWSMMRASPIIVPGETPRSVVVLVSDVTERKREQIRLRQLSTVVEQSPVSIVITDTKGHIEYVNPRFVQLTGYTLQEVIGKDPRQLILGAKSPEEYSHVWATITAGGEWRGELHTKKKNGELFWEYASISPIKNESGIITHFLAVKEDITERKVLEQGLMQAQKLESIGTLAGGIAHDFNNILAVIMGHAALLSRGGIKTDYIAKSVDAINKSVARGAGLVRQILAFARKTDILFEPILVNEIVSEMILIMNETFPKTITVESQLEPNLPPIYADKTQIHQTLLNLCVNARDAMPEGGVLLLTTTRISTHSLPRKFSNRGATDYVCISAVDTGTGMDEATRQRIFEPFFTTKAKGKGTGLGLAVIYGIIQSHHGFIDVQSELGKGTTFRTYFPIAVLGEKAASEQEQNLKGVSGGNEMILVIEDEAMLRELLLSTLEANGYKVLTASDGEQGLDTYKKHQREIVLVLTDLGLPKMDGGAMFRMMMKLNPNVKVIIASGYMDSESKSELLAAGAKAFLQKPYAASTALKLIREEIDRRNE